MTKFMQSPVILCIEIVFILFSLTKTSSKTFERCEFANILRYYYELDLDEVARWVCIAQEASGLNSDLRSLDSHGLFQINERSWCSPPGSGCNIECDKLRDDHITDDLACVKIIHAEHQRISGDGYTAWPVYQHSCHNQSFAYIENCFGNQLTIQYQGNTTENYRKDEKSKVYERCELARELYEEHNIPIEQVATWICIAHRASQLNTSSVRRRESDGSIAYGLFQISDQRWCSYKQHELRGCNLHCNRLRDGSIADDVECIKHIYKEQDALLGDGFMAWEVYLPYCHNQQNESVTQIAQCFDTNELKQNITKENSLESKNVTNKIYKYCELAHELYRKHDTPIEQIPIWLCIVQHESGFNTAAVARVNGAANHGLFQISDLYWCSHDRNGGKACNVSCDNLIDSDISDDVRCIKTIYEEHTDINQCFNENELMGPLNISTPTNESAMQTNLDTISDTTAKIYSKCELAQELYRKHHIPMEQIPIWVCIVQHVSGFNTSAIARLNADGSVNHGLFQISDLYWCSHDRNGGKACNISCDNLIDSDISDDVRCIKKIYEEHSRISGDGFTAWSVYKPHCLHRPLIGTRSCFSHQNADKIEIEINLSIRGTRIPELYEQIRASQNVSSNEAALYYETNLILNPSQEEPTSTIHSSNGYNQFVKGSFKLQLKKQDSQLYFSNPFLNDYFTNNNSEHNSMDSFSILSTRPPVLPGNLSAITTLSPYDKNSFSKGPIKAQVKENNDQVYISNPFLIGNSTNNNSEHNSMDSLATLSTSPPVLYGNLSVITTPSPYDSNPFFKLQVKGNDNPVYISNRFLNDNSTNNNPEHNSIDSLSTQSTSAPVLLGNLSAITTVSPYDNNPFLKGTIKLPAKENDNQMYLSNPLANDNSTNNNREHTLIDSLSILSTSAPVLRGNLSAITTVSPYDNNPFLKGPIKLPAKENDNQMYLSNPFVNDNSTNNNPEDTSMGSISTLSTSAPVLLGNLTTIITVSPYDNNPFLKRTIKLQAEENNNQMYFSNPLLNVWRANKLSDASQVRIQFKRSQPRQAGKTSSKTFERCEFANILRYYYELNLDEVAQWVCIAQEASGLNSDLRSLDSHGLFQINERFWCSPPGSGCNIECDKLRDDHITDDLACVKIIHAEHQRISGDGYTAWPVYQRSCHNQSFAYIENCFGNQLTSQHHGYSTKNYSRNEKSKVYGRCELARALYKEHSIPIEQVATWICIAHHESHFNTSAYGLFQISNLHWCSYKRYGLNRLIDENIADDVECIKRIYKEHAALFGDGFTAWTASLPYCRNQHYEHIASCFEGEKINDISYKQSASSLQPQYVDNPFFKQKMARLSGNDVFQVKKKDIVLETKVYEQCSLAQELYFKHNIPIHDVATWICIALHASHFDTSKIGPIGDDDSKSYGLFQINDRYWCSRYSYDGKGCNIPCTNLLDSDISDDIRCIKLIQKEHERISGVGFDAWTHYKSHCQNENVTQIAKCFNKDELKKDIPKNNGLESKTITNKIYKYCELAQELYHRHHIPMEQIPTWVCIAQYESSFNTAAIGRLNADGSADHGLFQISDLYWCSHDRYGSKACGIPCDNLLDSDIADDIRCVRTIYEEHTRLSDIADDIRCVRTIYEEHTRLSGNGFTAWTVYQPHCRNKRVEHINQCFNESELRETLNIGPSTNKNSIKTNLDTKSHKKGKIYNKCELAQELYHKHHIPMEQIATWVCIAQHESSFNTAAIGRLNADGSADHGLFQISDLYWCSHGRKGGKACSIPCDKLLDADISDDVRCIKIIYDQHTRISGDGFTAWTVYKPYCRERAVHETVSCFPSPKVDKIEKSSHSMNDVRKPKLYEQFGASQDVNIKNLGSSYKSNLFLNGFQKKDKNPTITTVASYDYNPFVNGSIKLQVEDNDSQMYVSNPFLNNNSKNNKLGHTSKNSSTKSPFYPHYTFSNVPTEKTQTLTTFSSTNKPALTWNSSTTPISRHLILNTIKPNLTNINKLTTGIRKIPVPVIITQAQPIKETTIWQNEKKDSLQNVDIYEPLPKINRFVTSTSKIPSITARTTILTKYTNTVIPTITTKQPITKQSTSKAWNFMESEKKSKTIIVNANRTSNTQGKARERTTSSNNKTCSGILDCSETTAEKPPTHKPTPKNVTSSVKAVKYNIVTTKKPQSAWSTSKKPNTLGHITGRRVSSATNNRTTKNPIKKSIKSNKLLLSYDWASYIKALNITSAIVTTKQPFITRTSHSSHDRQVNTIKLSKTIKERTTTTKSPTKAKTPYSTSTTKPNLSATTPSTDPFDHPFFARFKEQFKKNNVPRVSLTHPQSSLPIIRFITLIGDSPSQLSDNLDNSNDETSSDRRTKFEAEFWLLF
uniref:lysozyme n=1 Tax=Glossina palpalis gambiensis TaxID=67801 RepID=A0A1B0AVU7_9MUSC